MYVAEVCFSPGSDFVVVAYDTLGIYVLNNDMEVVRQITSLVNFETSFMCISPDGQLVLVGLSDLTMGMWSTKTGQKLYELDCEQEPPVGGFFLRDGNTVIASTDERLLWWDFKKGYVSREVSVPIKGVGGINSFQIASDEKSVVLGHLWGQVERMELETNTILQSYVSTGPGFTDACISRDRKWVAVCKAEVYIFDAVRGKLIQTLSTGHKPVAARFSPDSNLLLVTDGETYDVQLWDWKEPVLLRSLRGHTGAVTSVEWSTDGNRIVSGGWDGKAILWDANTGREIQRQTAR